MGVTGTDKFSVLGHCYNLPIKYLDFLALFDVFTIHTIKLHKNVPYTSIYSTVANIFLEDVNLTHGKNQSFVSTVQYVNRFNKEAIENEL